MPGSILKILFPSLVWLVLAGSALSQPSKTTLPEEDPLSWYIRMKYGLDQELYNGLQYRKRYLQYKGDSFFPDEHLYTGSVTLKGKPYDGLQLKYDCYSQDLILGYSDFNNQYNELIINSIHIDSFSLGSYRFKNIPLSDQSRLFYQVLGSGPVTCYIHWKRDIHTTHDDLRYSHEYTQPIGAYFIGYDGGIYPVTNRKNFLLIFPESLQPEIKRYLRRERFYFRDAGPVEIQNLIDFIGSHTESIPGP